MLDKDEALDFLATMGDCELVRGRAPEVQGARALQHARPGAGVLPRARPDLRGVHPQHEAAVRGAHRQDSRGQGRRRRRPSKPLGFVAVAAGSGQREASSSRLGVDVVVSGGQTMNPSTKDLLDAADQGQRRRASSSCRTTRTSSWPPSPPASCAEYARAAVVPTKTVPQAFAAMFGVDAEAIPRGERRGHDRGRSPTSSAARSPRAIKDSKDADGNAHRTTATSWASPDGAIDAVGSDVADVAIGPASSKMQEAEEGDSLHHPRRRRPGRRGLRGPAGARIEEAQRRPGDRRAPRRAAPVPRRSSPSSSKGPRRVADRTQHRNRLGQGADEPAPSLTLRRGFGLSPARARRRLERLGVRSRP